MATIYKILSPDLLECYVGSTIQDMTRRWQKHTWKSNVCYSKILLEKYGVENCKIVELEFCPLEERRKKEQWWLDHSVGAVNHINALTTKDMVITNNKKWREENVEHVVAYRQKNYQENREKRLAYARAYREANLEEINARRRARRAAKKSE